MARSIEFADEKKLDDETSECEQLFLSLPASVTTCTDCDDRECGPPKPVFSCPKSWNVHRDEIKLERKIGIGYFAEVWYGRWGDRSVAVKMPRRGRKAFRTSPELLQEAELMKKLRHRRFVSLYAVCSETEPVYLVLEYMNKGSLPSFFRDHQHTITDEVLFYVAAQIAEGMAFMESNGFIHRDLAARNVVMGDGYRAKICDFGLTRFVDGANIFNEKARPVLTERWAAPEVTDHGHFSIKSDVWSFGVLLTEICSLGKDPYPGMNDKRVVEEVRRGYRMPRPARPKQYSDRMYEAMSQCWCTLPERRPTFESLYRGFVNVLQNFLHDYATRS